MNPSLVLNSKMRRFLLFALTAGIALPLVACSSKKETSEDVSQPSGPTSLEDADASDVKDAPVPPKKGKPTLKVIK